MKIFCKNVEMLEGVRNGLPEVVSTAIHKKKKYIKLSSTMELTYGAGIWLAKDFTFGCLYFLFLS